MSFEGIHSLLPILDSLERNITLKDSQKILHDLLKSSPRAVDEIFHFQRKVEYRHFTHKLKLCCSQMAKVLPSLVKILSAGGDPALKEICHYLTQKLRWCLNEILRILNGGGVEDDSEPSGLFIQSIDKFVSFLHDGNPSTKDMNLLIDDLLCHALTIAKMAENEEYNEISAACRNVLASMSGITTMEQIEKEPLRKDTILCNLVTLERKVNIAVLKLYLYVMSRFLPPLKSIIKKAGIFVEKVDTRKQKDIQFELNSLDRYFERVQLIGNYAVACTECKKQKLKVQCSLANLEFLADYIINAAITYYLDSTSLIKMRFLQFLTDECIEELKTLTGYLDNIIDTPAFIQVLHEDLAHLAVKLREHFSKESYRQQNSKELITKCYKLVTHVRTTDDPLVKGNQAITTTSNKLLNVVKELDQQSRSRKAPNKDQFFKKLDIILKKVEGIEQLLTSAYLNSSQAGQNGTSIIERSSVSAVTSTPYPSTSKDSAAASSTKKAMPVTPRNKIHSLDPYLSKISETPILRSTIYTRTAYKTVKTGIPKNLFFNVSVSECLRDLPSEEVINGLSLRNGLGISTKSSTPSTSAASESFKQKKSSSSKKKGGSGRKSIPLDPEMMKYNSLNRKTDINFVENKMKKLSTKK